MENSNNFIILHPALDIRDFIACVSFRQKIVVDEKICEKDVHYISVEDDVSVIDKNPVYLRLTFFNSVPVEIPEIRICLTGFFWPETIVTAFVPTSSFEARNFNRHWLAFPLSGGDETLSFSIPSCNPQIFVGGLLPGTILTENIISLSTSRTLK